MHFHIQTRWRRFLRCERRFRVVGKVLIALSFWSFLGRFRLKCLHSKADVFDNLSEYFRSRNSTQSSQRNAEGHGENRESSISNRTVNCYSGSSVCSVLFAFSVLGFAAIGGSNSYTGFRWSDNSGSCAIMQPNLSCQHEVNSGKSLRWSDGADVVETRPRSNSTVTHGEILTNKCYY